MANYVYDDTPNSVAYQVMVSGQLPGTGTLDEFFAMPVEYQPISLQVEEDLDDLFVEPDITAAYFAVVDLAIGGEWVVTDYRNRVLYVCRVLEKSLDKRAGTVTYRFGTYMSLLSKYEPPSVLIGAADAGLGATATPNEALSYLVNRWRADHPRLSLKAPVPRLELRSASGPVVPYVHFLSVYQRGGHQNRSAREIIEDLFGCFEGYRYRLHGMRLEILPPLHAQTHAVTLGTESVVSRLESQNANTIVNSQTVNHRPFVKRGVFSKNPDNTPAVPNDLPEIGEPAFYRQGDTQLVRRPANRRFCPNGVPTPYVYSEDAYPLLDRVRVTFTAYVFANVTTDAQRTGDGLGSRASGVKVIDVSQHLVQQTHVVDLGVGPGARPFDAVFRWVDGPQSAVWVWRLKATPKGVRATLIAPVGNVTQEASWSPAPWWLYWIPIVSQGLWLARVRPAPATLGAEFHLNVQGQAWERSERTYTATYGVFSPPTLPPGVEGPPVETASDAQVAASFAMFGKRAAPELTIDTWTLSDSPDPIVPSGPELSPGEAAYEAAQAAADAAILKTLLDVAQTAVKERLLPHKTVTLELAPPFPVTARDLGRLIAVQNQSGGLETGMLQAYAYREVHALTGSQLGATVTVKVPMTTEMQPITIVPPAPGDDGEPFVPPGYPEGGDFAPLEPPEPPARPVLTASGMAQLELGRRFDLIRLKADSTARVRLYRTAAARAADASRAAGTWPDEAILPQLILEAFLEAPTFELDLHSILGHTPEGVVYANIQGATVTFTRFVPSGLDDRDDPPGAPGAP